MGKKSNAARFPLARIKKMIQADEDVGKVAQATPILVSKALELFLASLVEATVKDAQARGSQKLTPYGLKRAINQTPTLDFCSDLVESVPDPIEGQDDPDEAGPTRKRRQPKGGAKGTAPPPSGSGAGGGGGRKKQVKKRESDDEDDEDDGADAGEFGDADGDEEYGVKAETGSGAASRAAKPEVDDEDEDYEE
ncbi:hypothetical protein JCM10212_003722 [Sporobolomyces blumeae]